MVPDSVQLTLSCAGGGGWCSGDSSDPFPYREPPPPTAGFLGKKKGGGRREARGGGLCTRTSNGFYGLLCSIYHSHTQVQERAKPGIGIRSGLLATWKKAPP